MKRRILFVALTMATLVPATGQNEIPLYYELEETGLANTPLDLPAASGLKQNIKLLPNPFEWNDGQDTIKDFSEWSHRRYEISQEIQKYEIGVKPYVDIESQIDATFKNNVLTVVVTVDGKKLTLSSSISFPSGVKKPCPLMIGTSGISLPSNFFSGNGIATMTFTESQVNSYSQFNTSGNANGLFNKLYPEYSTDGAYAMWSWGVSRLIDGLYKLGSDVTGIDLAHIGVTGCSYAGKMALFAGAFDERIALTIAQEPGGGGAAAWRVSGSLSESVETLSATDGNWYLNTFKSNFSSAYNKLPYDHHELVAMCCPRAVLILGNPDYTWLADESTYVSSVAARKVWQKFGIEDRMGYSIVAGHSHCSLPQSQYSEVQNFINKFLLGKNVNTDVQIAPKYKGIVDAEKWTKDWNTVSGGYQANDSAYINAHKIWMEAENYRTADNGWRWSIVESQDSAVVSGGVYVENPEDWGSTTQSSDNADILDFEFRVPAGSQYTVFARICCDGSEHDAIFTKLNAKQWSYRNGLDTGGKWKWVSMLSTALVQPREHHFYIARGESGVKIDKILVMNYNEAPNGIGDSDGIVFDGVRQVTISELSLLPVAIDGSVVAGFCLPEAAKVSFNLYDMTGKIVAGKAAEYYPAGSNVIELNSSKLAGGTYVCRMQIGGSSISKKLIIK